MICLRYCFHLFFGAVLVSLVSKFNSGLFKVEVVKPTWNDNPLRFSRPLSFFHFLGFFFVVGGLSMVLGTAIGFQTLSYFGLTVISYGLGMFVGIWLALKWTKPKV